VAGDDEAVVAPTEAPYQTGACAQGDHSAAIHRNLPQGAARLLRNVQVCGRIKELQETISASVIALAPAGDVGISAPRAVCSAGTTKGKKPLGWSPASTPAWSRWSPNSAATSGRPPRSWASGRRTARSASPSTPRRRRSRPDAIKCCGLLKGPRAAGRLSAATIALEISDHNSRVAALPKR
jgi:hypothetical protein